MYTVYTSALSTVYTSALYTVYTSALYTVYTSALSTVYTSALYTVHRPNTLNLLVTALGNANLISSSNVSCFMEKLNSRQRVFADSTNSSPISLVYSCCSILDDIISSLSQVSYLSCFNTLDSIQITSSCDEFPQTFFGRSSIRFGLMALCLYEPYLLHCTLHIITLS